MAACLFLWSIEKEASKVYLFIALPTRYTNPINFSVALLHNTVCPQKFAYIDEIYSRH